MCYKTYDREVKITDYALIFGELSMKNLEGIINRILTKEYLDMLID